MKIQIILLLCFLQVIFSTRTYDDILDLDEDNFFETVGKDKYVIVEFYTETCKYCTIIIPELEKLHDHIVKNKSNVIIGKINGHDNRPIANRYQITKYPKIVLFYPGSKDIKSVFKGKRVFNEFSKWLDSNIQ